MTGTVSGRASASVDPDSFFTARARFDDPLFVVEMSGELDMASHAAAIRACTSIDHLDVLVDLSGLMFMDCAGYGALASSTTTLESRGGSMVLMNPVGEPQRLLALIEQLGRRLGQGLCAPLRYGALAVSPPTLFLPLGCDDSGVLPCRAEQGCVAHVT